MMDAFESMEDKQELIECDICSRSFNYKALERHIIICKKNSSKPRKVFDASKQRSVEAESSSMGYKAPHKSKPKSTLRASVAASKTSQASKTGNNTKWKQQHEEFISTIRSARQTTALLAAGKPLPPPPPPAENPDYVRCEYCDRRFNSTAAERHIPYCKEKRDRLPPAKQITATAKLRNDARLMYKAPRLRKTNAADSSMDTSVGFKASHSTTSPAKPVSQSASRSSTHPPPSSQHDLHQQQQQQQKLSVSGTRKLSSKHGSGEFSRVKSSSSSSTSLHSSSRQPRSPYCHECGNLYVVESAKFCCECGVRRLGLCA